MHYPLLDMCVIVFLVVRTCEHINKKKTRKKMTCTFLSSWLWRPVSSIVRRRLGKQWCMRVVIFLAVKTCEHNSKKKTMKMSMCVSLSSWLWRLVSTIARKRPRSACTSSSFSLLGLMNTKIRKRLGKWRCTCHCLPSYEDLWVQ